MTTEELNIHIAELLGNAYDHKTGKVDLEYLDSGIRAIVRKVEDCKCHCHPPIAEKHAGVVWSCACPVKECEHCKKKNENN